jgi:hypothetical protein
MPLVGLTTISQSIFLSTPDMFVIPKVWVSHSTLLQQVLLNDIQSIPHKPAVFSNVGSVMESNYKKILARVQVFTDLTPIKADTDNSNGRPGSNVDVRTNEM